VAVRHFASMADSPANVRIVAALRFASTTEDATLAKIVVVLIFASMENAAANVKIVAAAGFASTGNYVGRVQHANPNKFLRDMHVVP
jgi:hypothetical protein